jgi:hypothetical protein
MRRFLILAALATVSAAPAPAPRFDPVTFFSGRTEGVGTMKIMLRGSRAVRVQGHGQVQRDGSIVLDQTVNAGGKSQSRKWHLRETAPGRYSGTLSDARGAVAGDSAGNRFHLAYQSKSGFAVEQWITLAADGRSARNLLTAKKFGMTVGKLDETIRKLD